MEARKLTTRKGMSVETDLTDEEALAALRSINGNDFARKLVYASGRNGGLSPDQLAWAHKLALEALGRNTDQPAATERLRIRLPAIVALFRRASEHLQRPKLTFDEVAGVGSLLISQAGERSRNPGSLNVMNGSRDVFYGRIHLDGWWEAGYRAGPEAIQLVLSFLQRLEEDPAGVAGEYGRRSGNCCFCHRTLTDERSLAVGYGPICAEKFGLPWGTEQVIYDPRQRELPLPGLEPVVTPAASGHGEVWSERRRCEACEKEDLCEPIPKHGYSSFLCRRCSAAAYRNGDAV